MIPFASNRVTKMHLRMGVGMKGNCNAAEVYPIEASTTTSRKECHLLILILWNV